MYPFLFGIIMSLSTLNIYVETDMMVCATDGGISVHLVVIFPLFKSLIFLVVLPQVPHLENIQYSVYHEGATAIMIVYMRM